VKRRFDLNYRLGKMMLQPFAQVSPNMIRDLSVAIMQDMTSSDCWVSAAKIMDPKTEIENIKQEKPPV
jgi:hypothetical protein